MHGCLIPNSYSTQVSNSRGPLGLQLPTVDHPHHLLETPVGLAVLDVDMVKAKSRLSSVFRLKKDLHAAHPGNLLQLGKPLHNSRKVNFITWTICRKKGPSKDEGVLVMFVLDVPKPNQKL